MFVKHFGFVQATESRFISTQTNIFLFLGKEEIVRECVCEWLRAFLLPTSQRFSDKIGWIQQKRKIVWAWPQIIPTAMAPSQFWYHLLF